MKKSYRLGLIGVGNMGTAILQGALSKKCLSARNILLFDRYPKKVNDFAKKTKAKKAKSLKELVENSDVILLGCKPQDMESLALEIKPWIEGSHKTVISILAGVQTKKFKKYWGAKPSIVRVMPNLAASVGASVSAVCGSSKSAVSLTRDLFSGCGEVLVCSEKDFDVVTAMSGSGPAYFFHLAELVESFGVKKGLSRKAARTLAVQTALGSGLLLDDMNVSPSDLRERVTSKKGTTDAALKTLKAKKFDKIFHSALEAAAKRSRELSR